MFDVGQAIQVNYHILHVHNYSKSRPSHTPNPLLTPRRGFCPPIPRKTSSCAYFTAEASVAADPDTLEDRDQPWAIPAGRG